MALAAGERMSDSDQGAASRRVIDALETTLTAERVMVCVSSAAGAQRVIRVGARMAQGLGAPCYAVYVETPREAPDRIRPQDAAALRRNIALAEEFGATVVRVKASRPADGLIAFARREGITHVVFGQSARTRWEILWKGSILNRFLREVGGATVQVVPLNHGAAEDRTLTGFL
jgi:two-component system sensor histidine kinase KdpD